VIKKVLKIVAPLMLVVAITMLLDSWMAKAGMALGLVVNGASLQALYQGFKQVFQDAFNKATPQYTKIAMLVDSSAEEEVYTWFGAWPKMRQWIGERQYKLLRAFKWTIANLKWESTVAVDGIKIRKDTYGTYRPRFTAMGASAAMHPDHIVFPLLMDGFTKKCYDGKTFFAADHSFGSNKGVAALTPDSFADAIAEIGQIEDSEGNPLFDGSETFTLVTGPALEKTAKIILNNDLIADGGVTINNPNKGAAEYVKSPLIKSATAWFIVVDFQGMKPLIFQKGDAADFQYFENAQQSEHVFKNDEYLYGTYSYDNSGYALPQLCYGSTGAGA
jgi:phage major head subunit gpT-like protein